MKAHLLFCLMGLVCLSSCVNTKYVYRSNRLYRLTTPPPPAIPPAPGQPTAAATQVLDVFQLKKGFKATITEKPEGLIITPVGGTPAMSSSIPINTAIQGFRAENLGKIYFPEAELDPDGAAYTKLNYFDSKPVLQALSIPLRFRPKLRNAALADSFPQQVETGVNVGIALGWKFTHNVYNSKQGVFGQTTNRYALSPGYFMGLGATDLKKSNTRGPTIVFERKAAVLTKGFYLMLGVNSINIGGAVGWDSVLGSSNERKGWLYQGKTWYGVIVAVDLLK